MKRDFALVRASSVFEQVDSLPSAQGQLAVDHRHGKLHLRERRSQVRGHVIGALVIVGVATGILGRELLAGQREA